MITPLVSLSRRALQLTVIVLSSREVLSTVLGKPSGSVDLHVKLSIRHQLLSHLCVAFVGIAMIGHIPLRTNGDLDAHSYCNNSPSSRVVKSSVVPSLAPALFTAMMVTV